jgi:hypothetical protein
MRWQAIFFAWSISFIVDNVLFLFVVDEDLPLQHQYLCQSVQGEKMHLTLCKF